MDISYFKQNLTIKFRAFGQAMSNWETKANNALSQQLMNLRSVSAETLKALEIVEVPSKRQAGISLAPYIFRANDFVNMKKTPTTKP